MVTVTVLAVDVLRVRGAGGSSDAPATLLIGGTLAGLVVAGVTTWRLLAPLGSAYRRGGLAISSGIATVGLMLVTIPVHQVFGRPGLATLAALCAGGALILRRAARRAVGTGA